MTQLGRFTHKMEATCHRSFKCGRCCWTYEMLCCWSCERAPGTIKCVMSSECDSWRLGCCNPTYRISYTRHIAWWIFHTAAQVCVSISWTLGGISLPPAKDTPRTTRVLTANFTAYCTTTDIWGAVVTSNQGSCPSEC